MALYKSLLFFISETPANFFKRIIYLFTHNYLKIKFYDNKVIIIRGIWKYVCSLNSNRMYNWSI